MNNNYLKNIDLLIDAGTDLSAQNNNGFTALMVAIDFWNPKIIDLLIKRMKRNELDLKDYYGRTALMHLIKSKIKLTVKNVSTKEAEQIISDFNKPNLDKSDNKKTKTLKKDQVNPKKISKK